jgi:hypothetical protein
MITKTAAIYAIMAVLVVMASTQLYTFILLHRDPITYEKVWTDTPEVKIGGVFRAHYALTRTRPCRTEVSTFMENEQTREVVRRENYVGGARAPGSYKDILLAFRLPPPAEPGCYYFSTQAINYCPEGTHIIQAPLIHFCVVE